MHNCLIINSIKIVLCAKTVQGHYDHQQLYPEGYLQPIGERLEMALHGIIGLDSQCLLLEANSETQATPFLPRTLGRNHHCRGQQHNPGQQIIVQGLWVYLIGEMTSLT